MLPNMAPINGVAVHCTMKRCNSSAGPPIGSDVGMAPMAALAARPITRTSSPAQDPLPAAAAMVAPVAGKPSLKALARHR